MKIEQIYIPQLLKIAEHKQTIIFDDQISGLQTLTPIRGNICINHRGNFLEVELSADTILTLTCDRCLQTYNHRLTVNTSEIIWLNYQEEKDVHIPLEREIIQDDLWESLPPDGYFPVENWIYEQLSLAMPLRQLCGKNCQAPVNLKEDKDKDNLIDDRWSALAYLKSQIQE
jgi:uncharacterized protein